jgi:hypothetical protein
MRKIALYIYLLLQCAYVFSQHKPLLYGFQEISQSLFVNPGAKVNQQMHIGFPFLSGIYVKGASSGISVYDVFADDNVDFNLKVRRALDNLGRNDAFSVNEQLQIIDVGFAPNTLNAKDYYSFGMYQELDVYSRWPEDPAILFYEGNFSNLGKRFSMRDISARGEVLTVFHFGINRKIDNKLIVGARVKIYNSLFEASSVNNRGFFLTQQGNTNLYSHMLSGDISVNSAGIASLDNTENESKELINRAFFGGNLGVGFDVGFTYQLSEQETLSGSLQDVGLIWYSKDVKRYTVDGTYVFTGLEVNFPQISNTPSFNDYWEALKAEIKESINYQETTDGYIRFRPIKLNAAYTYSFGKRKNDDCECVLPDWYNQYTNGVGAQLYAIKRPRGPDVALTGFYYRNLFRGLSLKTTYTIDKYSFTNVGLGLSSQIGSINLYLLAENLLEFKNLAKANTVAVQFGLNYIVKHKTQK